MTPSDRSIELDVSREKRELETTLDNFEKATTVEAPSAASGRPFLVIGQLVENSPFPLQLELISLPWPPSLDEFKKMLDAMTTDQRPAILSINPESPVELPFVMPLLDSLIGLQMLPEIRARLDDTSSMIGFGDSGLPSWSEATLQASLPEASVFGGAKAPSDDVTLSEDI